MEFRPIHWSRDGEAVLAFDASYVTDRIYALKRDGLNFSLVEEACDPPFHKRYHVSLDEETMDTVLVSVAAWEGEALLGFALVREERWNRRAVLADFYITPDSRGQGIGTAMLDEVIRRVAETESRHLWIESQNINFPAIQFYRQMGFEICGFDAALYDGRHSKEIAIYLVKDIAR
jgi:ribosomal protein S18 acetylase RimI-like enzyme